MNKNLVYIINMKCAENFLNRQNMPFLKKKYSAHYKSLWNVSSKTKKEEITNININIILWKPQTKIATKKL